MHRLVLTALALHLPACVADPSDSDSTTTTTTTGGSSGATTGPGASESTTPTTGAVDPGSTTLLSTGEGATDACEWAFFTVELTRPDVMLVLDKSGSMVSDALRWDHDGDPNTPKTSRWASLHAAVAGFADTYQGRMQLGAVLFPALTATNKYDVSACAVDPAADAPLAVADAAAILAAIPPADATDLHGATPTAAGITTALTELTAQPGDVPRHIILVTDGAANCAVDAVDDLARFEVLDPHLAELVGQALADGITTQLVGIEIPDTNSGAAMDGDPDNINPHAELAALAIAGGLPQPGPEPFANVHDEPALHAALATLGDRLLSCTVDFSSPLPQELLLKLRIGDQDFSPDPVADCSGQDGWRFVDPGQTAIELCGSACAAFKESGSADFIYSPC